MDSFSQKVAVITGGGSGIGRELVLQLAAEGCSVATCDISDELNVETVALARSVAVLGATITGHSCDVSEESQVLRFRNEVMDRHNCKKVDLLFNNAGIGGGGSFVTSPRSLWERTFSINWWGVYFSTRAFLPLLVASSEAMIINTSSINGFWATLGPGIPHSAYSTAKFAVKGFSESLIEDLRVNAPHVKVAVVIPGHVGTDIVANSRRILGQPNPISMSESEIELRRVSLFRSGKSVEGKSTEDLRQMLAKVAEDFRTQAPTSASAAASSILEGIRLGQWRILVGEDAKDLDELVRCDPERAYDYGASGTFQ